MNELQKAIAEAAKKQVAWEKDTVYKWQKQPTITKSKKYGTCVTYVACVLHRVGVLEPGSFLWTNGSGFGTGKVIGANGRMTVTYYHNSKTLKQIFETLQPCDILIFDDNKSGKVGSCGHICIYNGKTYKNGIHTFTGGHIISVNGKEKWSRKPLAVVRINSMPARKTVDQIAHEVLDGKWGSGDKRKENIIDHGYDYDAVQKRVNEILLIRTEPTTKPKPKKIPSLTLKKTNAQAIADTIKWACWIAGDNRFHYGHGKEAHHNGCYFCGTEDKLKKGKGIVDYQHTYCCNPFVGAAWAHGGCVPAALRLCQACKSWDFHKGRGYDKSKLFDNLGHPKKSSLRPGDVLCRDTHVALYIGNGKIAEASGGDDNKRNSEKWNNSIRVKTLTDENYKNFPRVHRFRGSVDTTMYIRHGEVSDRVKDLQAYLKITADGIFGDATLSAVRAYQKAHGLTADGIVGPATIKKMEAGI